ncbi:MAG: acyl-CoA thioesterase-1, partial [Candidatus Marinamargulisbacteria bacterium]
MFSSAIFGTQTIVFFGDSLTAGYHVGKPASFPAVIQSKLKEAGLNWRVINAGVSGDSTYSALPRLSGVLDADPDLVVVALGANDILRRMPLNQTEKHLREIIEVLQERQVGVVLAGIDIPFVFKLVYRQDIN